ncbi:MAG: methyltransferase domain-containing protein [Thermaerobacter sp.]|nr:methyltransferase domain-containing protein [Thermaerobacter sp.]
MDQRDKVQQQFGKQAAKYTHSPSHAFGHDLGRLLELLPLQPEMRALDVATGTGHTALALAALVREVVAVDITPEMLAEARQLAKERRVENVVFQEGDAEALPFPDQVFDAVTCRRAPHHFPNIPGFLAEVSRVLRSGGSFGLADQTTPEFDSGRDFIETFEKLRDPSHVHALSPSDWRAAIEGAGLHVAHLEVQTEDRDVEEYLDVAGVPAERRAEIYRRIAASPREAAEMNGFHEVNGRLRFERRRVITVARR